MIHRLQFAIMSAISWTGDHPIAFGGMCLNAAPTLLLVVANMPPYSGWLSFILVLLCLPSALLTFYLAARMVSRPPDRADDWIGRRGRREVIIYLVVWMCVSCTMGAYIPELSQSDPARGWVLSSALTIVLLIWSNIIVARHFGDTRPRE